MVPHHSDILMKQAQYADLLKEAESERLIRTARLLQPDRWQVFRKVTYWLGNQLVKWGAKLQAYSQAPLLEVTSRNA